VVRLAVICDRRESGVCEPEARLQRFDGGVGGDGAEGLKAVGHRSCFVFCIFRSVLRELILGFVNAYWKAITFLRKPITRSFAFDLKIKD